MVRVGSSVEWLKDIDQQDAYAVGQTVAQLGEHYSHGIPFPPSFVIPNSVHISFFRYNNLETKIKHLLSTIHYNDQRSVSQVAYHIQKIICSSHLMPESQQEVQALYKQLSGTLSHTAVTIQPSLVSFDFQVPLLSDITVQGEATLIESIKEAYSQIFSAAVLSRLHETKQSPFSLSLSLLVRQVLVPEVSGILFTQDPVTMNKDVMVIEAVHGLKELFMHGELTPDHYEVDKKTGKVVERYAAAQDEALIQFGVTTKKIKLSRFQRKKPKLDEKQIQQLVQLGNHIQELLYFPQDVEWCIAKGILYVTKLSQLPVEEKQQVPEHKKLSARMNAKPLARGIAHGKGMYTGQVKVVRTVKDVESVRIGDILVTARVTSDLISAIKRAGAVVSEFGGLASAPLRLQNFGKPMVSGISQATTQFKSGMVLTVNGMTGEIYRGGALSLEKDVRDYNIGEYTKTNTKLICLTDPTNRSEIISDGAVVSAGQIIKDFGVHPRKLLREGDAEILTNKIDIELSHAYDSMHRYVIFYQLSDLTPAEYKKLHGGKEYESFETESLLGYRGAYRLLHEPDVLEIELDALKQFQQRHRPASLQIILPTVRMRSEMDALEKLLRSSLHTHENLHIWLKIDTPMVALSLSNFLHAGVEGIVLDVSILATLLTGVGLDVDELTQLKVTENPVLEAFILKVIVSVKAAHKKIMITGIDNLDATFFEWIVAQEVDEIMLPQQLLEKARRKVLNIEERSKS